MDLNTIDTVIYTTDPFQWRNGDAWLAGGTVLFSFSNKRIKRLLDITQGGWTSLIVSPNGIEIAATCTIAQLYELPSQSKLAKQWPALELVQLCCESFLASFKIWNMSTVGGNLCTALPAGPMISLTVALDGIATIWTVDGASRFLPIENLVIGDEQTSLKPGELLRSIELPSAVLESQVSFRRLSLSNLGRSAVLIIGRLDADATFVLTITASTKRPVKLRFEPSPNHKMPDRQMLQTVLDSAIPEDLYHDDVHGLPLWRRDMTYQLAEEIRVELSQKAM